MRSCTVAEPAAGAADVHVNVILSEDADRPATSAGFAFNVGSSGRQSSPSSTPSLSSSVSQASPAPSLSVSVWALFATVGQLSTLSQIASPSASMSVWTHPLAGLHVSTVQESLSSQPRVPPPPQMPLWQWVPPVQMSPSSHEAFSLVGWCVQTPSSQTSKVHELLSSQLSCVPRQLPLPLQ